MTDTELRSCLDAIVDPELGRTLGELRMVKQASVSPDGVAAVEIELPTPAYPQQERFQELVNSAVRAKFADAPDAVR